MMRRSIALLSLAAILTAALWLFSAPRAEACSCEGISSASIERGDAGLIGFVEEMTPIPPIWEGQQRFVAEISVGTDLKDNLADVVYVTSEVDDGGNCGVGWQPGTEIAAVIYEDDGVFRTDGCSTMRPALAEAWQPATTVGGDAILLIGGGQPYRMVAYDQSGSPIAFAFDEGEVRAASLCPGGETMLELVNNYEAATTTIDTRSLATFEITASVPAEDNGAPLQLRDLRCDSPDGSQAMTTGYALTDGVFKASTAPLVPSDFDQEAFWPEFDGGTDVPIPGESWMTVALGLDEPATIDATGRSAVVRDLGAGFSFGLAEDSGDGDGDAGEPLVREDASQEVSSSTVYWAGGIGLALGIGIAVLRGKRKKQR